MNTGEDSWEEVTRSGERLGELAVRRGLITPEQLESCLLEQVELRKKGQVVMLGQILLRDHLLDGMTLARLLRGEVRAPPPPPRLERFEYEEKIGEGGMAEVFRAHERGTDLLVAVKLLKPEVAQDITRKRFHREADVVARLHHPNVVRLLESGEAEGRMYLVMEYVSGKSLGFRLKETPEPIRPYLEILEKAARGVHHAHEQGIIHRDLKPANILIDASGEPKVSDFGLAHFVDPEDDEDLTRTGTTLGTPLYMSPEQVLGVHRNISARTDVYSLGAILYGILTGHPPHEGDSTAEIYDKILEQEPVRPAKIKPDVPRELETIALKAIEKDPELRFASALDFAQDLRLFLDGRPILTRRVTTVTRVWRRIAKGEKKKRLREHDEQQPTS